MRRALVDACMLVLAGTVLVAGGSASSAVMLAAPTGLQAFQLRLGDGRYASNAFVSTPSFAWKPTRGATHYEFQLAANKGFTPGSGLIWSSRTFRSPVAAIPISLPWIANGSLYWRVRALAEGDASSTWSKPAGFRMQPGAAPVTVSRGAGYVKWAAASGATAYDVWFVNLDKVVRTIANAADLRDYYAEGAPTVAVWRVRAERRVYGSDQRSLPVVSYGPWSTAHYASVAPNHVGGLATLSLGVDARQLSPTHTVMPVFLFPVTDPTQLRHVYVATDLTCTDIVFNSAVVAGGAFAPRALQSTERSGASSAVNDGPVFTAAGKPIEPTEANSSGFAGSANVDLPSGRYYWTVVPVVQHPDGTYHDVKSPAAACTKNRANFTKTVSSPALGTSNAPFATGLTPLGHLAPATTTPARFYGAPLVAWRPVPGASEYRIEWSHYKEHWQGAGAITTFATSAALPLTPGTWWYHVRAIDTAAPYEASTGWSVPQMLEIATPTFSVVG
jgi:hypothetical protein